MKKLKILIDAIYKDPMKNEKIGVLHSNELIAQDIIDKSDTKISFNNFNFNVINIIDEDTDTVYVYELKEKQKIET